MNSSFSVPLGLSEGPKPDRLWSLWDMISANLMSLAPLIYQLSLYQLVAERNDDEGDEPLSENIAKQVAGWLKIAATVADDFEIKAAHGRIRVIQQSLEKGMTWNRLSTECRVLREIIVEGLKHQLIYRYSDEKSSVLVRWKEDWKIIYETFPPTQPDILAAVDCWALGHGTAAVFHLMRVLEYGIEALARNVGREPGIQNWQNIIDQIECEIRHLGKTLPSGKGKSDRMRFLSEAAKEFVYFKDGWRNYVSHNRATYDEHQARSVLEHVRSFMTVVAEQLSEESSG